MVPISPLNRVGIALAEPVRQQVLLALLDGPARPSELLARVDVSKTNLSNHLACLRGCGLIVGITEGRSITYRLVSDDLEHALRDLLRLEACLCPHDQTAPAEPAVPPRNAGPRAPQRSRRVNDVASTKRRTVRSGNPS